MTEPEQLKIFEDWLERHQGLLFKVVRAYAFNQHDQDDLFQEITSQVWNSIPRFERRSAETTWLYRVAIYAALGWTKKEVKHRQNKEAIQEGAHALLPSKSSNPQLDWLYEQIAELDMVDRSITLMMLDGFSYKDISETLGISESNVGVKLNRIKKHLTQLSNDKHHEIR
ncbi:RNA polymerase sigma factor [Verrucomicrobia bacterium]|nr:RNA polymerase sigma factor [Verrucomicrobiota bacterium]